MQARSPGTRRSRVPGERARHFAMRERPEVHGAAPFFGSAAPTASPAGLSSLKPFVIDHFMTAPMRPRTFFAVTGLVDQIGNRMLITSADVMSLTRRAPILGIA